MKRSFTHIVLIFILALIVGYADLPFDKQKNVFPFTPQAMEAQKVHLGLDLQGGTQLDYKVDLRKVSEADHDQIIEGVLEVITRRVNGLGVSEPNIYRSKVADEEHIMVELAGIKDLNEAKAIVGKTIQLEFKEENREPLTDANVKAIKNQANTALERIQNGELFTTVGQEEQLANPGRAYFFESKNEEEAYTFESDLSDEFVDYLEDAEPGTTIDEVIDGEDGYTVDANGNLVPLKGLYILNLIDKKEGEREIKESPEVKVSHVLIAYKGSERAGDDVTRSKEEAQKLAEEVREKALAGEDFADLAEQYSDEPGSEASGGDLGTVKEDTGFVQPFKEAALALKEDGEISAVTETSFGFHIIRANKIVSLGKNEKSKETKYLLNRLYYSTDPDPWKATELTGEHFIRADVELNQTYTPYVSIQFNDEGGKLFEEITGRNIDKPLAIFVGGQLISAPNVNDKISGGSAQITGSFTLEEANNLARDLNTGAIPAPILLVGQYTIGATLGQEALTSSVKAGLLGVLLLALYMILIYRLPGLLATIALFIYSLILLFFIKVAIPLGLALLISLGIFIYIVAAILRNQDSGAEKLVSFLLACFVLFFIAYLLATPVVLTLAGVAGVVLSIGMAVDANILIFERMKEEMYKKRPLASAVEVGFERAWSSIRDSNFSSLLTCAILMYFGTSIIRGFAVNLALGILVSMFTAITLSRTFLRTIIQSKLGKNGFLMGVPKRGHWQLHTVRMRKIWFSLSGSLVIASIVLLAVFGLKFGMDFTGGTLIELKFQTPVTAEQITGTIKQVEEKLKEANGISATDTEATDTEAPQLSYTSEIREELAIDFGAPVIVSSGENQYIVRIKHISPSTHDQLLAALQTDLGSLEETRYTTIGSTIGSKMKQKAIMALLIATVMIIVYIAFAFRQVPKSIGAWRFGLTAIVALIHDLLITLGVFVVLGQVLNVEVDALFITALLTIMGFSVHDTIVVFDRLRENLRHQGSGETFETVAERAVNETIVRSFNTSFSSFMTVAVLFFLGAISIKYFLLALMIGFVVGTYSSIFVATPLLVSWNKKMRQ